MTTVDKTSRTPLYLQLMNILIDIIENTLEENEQILSEREICEIYDVSRTTVRQAMDELEKEGYIYKVHGKGTFVSPRRMNQDLISFYSFTEEMKKLGKKPKSEVTGFEIIQAGDKISSIFKISSEDLLYKISRIRMADGIHMLYETTYLPFNRFKGITREQLEEKPMYDVLIKEFNARLTSAEEFFQPILTNKLESIYLDIKEGSPSLKIERLTYENESVIEYTVSVARGDKFKYRVKLNNN
ncbi:GntR family transcriptional regulator [Clostridium sartagoforme AAU1]|uniref:GntR family transcriptional regulator n=1 Tax=Clostridium sartagoforme AAU1 TaxID=1202534 RepID=R9CGE1_9CLOT|nr:GntR family transcriptional regulator [Clostridium sartagoforme]EOR28110.1 GntR family transcriptional regulator [Clostridium sartagoforme AAU1]